MRLIRKNIKRIARITLVTFAAASLYMPAAQAGMIATADVIQQAKIEQQRADLKVTLQREDIQRQLLAMGVDPAMVQARVANLSDTEIGQLAGKLEQLPAGGDSLIGALVFVFIVLLITDLLGLTDVFPFVKKTVKID